MINKINKSNIERFLKYFGEKIGKSFDAETIARWKGLDDDTLYRNLDKLLQHFGYTDTESANRLISDFLDTQKIKPNPRTQQSRSNDRPIARPMVDDSSELSYSRENEPAVADTSGGGRSIGRVIFVVLLLSVIAGAAYLWTKYSEYSSRSQVYCLASNLSVRKDLLTSDKWDTRMDMFGSYRDATGTVHSSTESLPLVDGEMYDDYYKVYMDTSFTQYLLDGENAIGYVHSKFVTTRESEYDRYKEVFQHFSDDYSEMGYMPMSIRRILVNAIYNYGDLKGKILSPPCYKAPRNDKNAPKSIGSIEMKTGAAISYIVIARIGGLYYTIHSNQDATELYVDATKIKKGYAQELLSEAGKFTSIGGAGAAARLQWANCDQSIKAVSQGKPYNLFVVGGMQSSPAPQPTIDDSATHPQEDEDFIEDVQFTD